MSASDMWAPEAAIPFLASFGRHDRPSARLTSEQGLTIVITMVEPRGGFEILMSKVTIVDVRVPRRAGRAVEVDAPVMIGLRPEHLTLSEAPARLARSGDCAENPGATS